MEKFIIDNYIDNTLGETDLNIGWSILEELTFAKDSVDCANIALDLVEKIIEKCNDDAILSRVGAGVVESLLRNDHEPVYQRILTLAKSNDDWASILKYTWFRDNNAYRLFKKDFPDIAVLGHQYGEAEEEESPQPEPETKPEA